MICLEVMFTPRITVIEMPQIAHFLHILLMTTNNYLKSGQKCFMYLKDLIEFFQKMLWLVGF